MNKQISKGFKRIGMIILIIGIIAFFALLFMSIRPKKHLTYWVITDPDCKNVVCGTGSITEELNNLLPDYSSEIINVYSPEGINIRQEFNILKVPVVYFNLSLQDSDAYKNNDSFRNELIRGNDGFLLSEDVLNSTYFIDTKARIAYQFKLYPDIMRVLYIQPMLVQTKPQIDFFIIPFDNESNKIEEQMRHVYDELKDNATFYPRFIVSQANITGCEYFSCSPHGLQELHEVARELCAYYDLGPDNYFDFAITMNRICNANNADNCWINAVDNTSTIRNCYDTDARGIIIDERNVASGVMNITKPTIYINGLLYNDSINSSIIKRAVCNEYNTSFMPITCKEGGGY